jgi:hypothetical protein
MIQVQTLEVLENLVANHNPYVLNLTLIRGLPGTGKSTYAGAYEKIGYNVIDDDAMVDREKGIYDYDQLRVPLQYDLDIIKAKASLKKGKNTCVVGIYPTGNKIRNLREIIYQIDYKALGFKSINFNIVTMDREPPPNYICDIPQRVQDHLKSVFQKT